MTSQLEKIFFNTFGIEPDITSRYHHCEKDLNCKECNEAKVIYPQITDRILLELIFILTTLLDTTVYEDVFITVAKNREELKKDIFQECMLYKQHIKQQVRRLFEEE